MEKENNRYIGYEYRDFLVSRNVINLYKDNLPNFGWQLDGIGRSITNALHVLLRLKRDRTLRNKAELSRLQQQFESKADTIRTLENSKTIGASIAAYGIGIIGTAFVAGSYFFFQAGHMALMVTMAIPGFSGWVIPYFYYNYLFQRKSKIVNPEIETLLDEIYETGKQAFRLLDKK